MQFVPDTAHAAQANGSSVLTTKHRSDRAGQAGRLQRPPGLWRPVPAVGPMQRQPRPILFREGLSVPCLEVRGMGLLDLMSPLPTRRPEEASRLGDVLFGGSCPTP